MRALTPALIAILLLMAACPSASAPGGNVAGTTIGADFDGNPFTIGEGDLEGKGVLVVYFSSW